MKTYLLYYKQEKNSEVSTMENSLEKMFTVEDIAQMTSLTDRTIRNYLRTGLLKGRKIGGQWRFNMQDIKNFLDSGEVMSTISSEYKQDVLDFIDNVNTKISGDRQSCVIIDLYISHDKANSINEKLCELTALDTMHQLRLCYEYSEEYQRARFTVFSSPEIAVKMLSLINEN